MSKHGRAPTWLALLALLTTAVVLLPLTYLFVRAAGADVVAETFSSRTAALASRSLALAVTAAVFAVLIGTPLAWLTTRTDVPGRRLWTTCAVLPLAIPSYVGALIAISAFSPRTWFGRAMRELGVSWRPDDGGLLATSLILAVLCSPYVYLTVRAALQRIDPQREEAARSLGLGPGETFVRVLLPQLRVPALAGALLVALYALSDFGAVSLLRFDSFTRVIYSQYQSSFDRSAAALSSILLALLCLVILLVERALRGRVASAAARTKRQARVRSLGRWRWPATAACAAFFTLTLLVPVVILVIWSMPVFSGAEPLGSIGPLALRSVLLAAGAAAAITVVTIPLAVFVSRYRSRRTAVLETATHVSFGLPGIVVALGFVFWAVRVAPWIYQSVALLILAYLTLFLPHALSPLRSSLVQLSPRIEDAARALGSSSFATLRRVTIPAISPSLVAAFALVFLSTIKELPATLILGPTEFSTLATRIWQASSESFFARAAVPSLVLLFVSAAILTVALRWGGERGLE